MLLGSLRHRQVYTSRFDLFYLEREASLYKKNGQQYDQNTSHDRSVHAHLFYLGSVTVEKDVNSRNGTRYMIEHRDEDGGRA